MKQTNVKSGKAQAEERPMLEIVVFSLEGESFGIDIYRVAEITRIMNITKVPRSLAFIEGVINLRGKIIPVVDLRQRLGLPSKARDKNGRIIIIKFESIRLGLLVDSVSRVSKIPKDAIEAVPMSTLQINSELIEGVGRLEKELIIILNLDKIITLEERQQLSAGQKGAAA